MVFTVAPADLDERPLAGEPVADRARRLALDKAQHVAASFPGAVVIGGDQVGYLPTLGRELDKCSSAAAAREQLLAMSGQTHVFRSAAVVLDDGRLVGVAEELAEVTFHVLSDERVEAYLATGEWQGACGAYRLEGQGAGLVSRRRGPDTAILGFPLAPVLGWLAACGCR